MTTRPILYVAHPLRPTDAEIAAHDPMLEPVDAATHANLRRAMRWLTWLRRTFPTITFVAPWIASVLAGDADHDPALREAGIADAVTLIPRLDGVVLVGGRVSGGMQREAEVARRTIWLVMLWREPPPVVPEWLAAEMQQLIDAVAVSRAAEVRP